MHLISIRYCKGGIISFFESCLPYSSTQDYSFYYKYVRCKKPMIARFFKDAEDGNRTRTVVTHRRILSLETAFLVTLLNHRNIEQKSFNHAG
jgi:hypothetical protein